MPENPDINLEEIKSEVEKTISSSEAKIEKIEEQPIAFGLKALIASISMDESKDADPIQNSCSKIPGVSSCEITDYRRDSFQ